MNTLMRKELVAKRNQILNDESKIEMDGMCDFLLDAPPPPPPRELLDSPTSIIMDNINNFEEHTYKKKRRYLEITDEVVNGNALYSIVNELKEMNKRNTNYNNNRCSNFTKIGVSILVIVSLIVVNDYILLEYLI